ncbi:response regulator [Aliishimia ponticola]|uniref:Response regulator n=1 Tax=Aliishimia ponticola TaxID=2499833 RepID=A0A4S4NL73_9RHOB|nr:response regulator [Aliishimia ponticola]THH39038.1 response regulator [Aliishimia ponticola]
MKCLIVEDMVSDQLDFETAMIDIGFTCWCTRSAADGAYLLLTHDFDLILLDLQVQDGDTLQLADYIQVMGARSTIILLTGSGAFPHGEAATLSPRIDYVMRKPVNIVDLQSLASYACTSKS